VISPKLLTGVAEPPRNEIKHTGKPMFDELSTATSDRLEQFMNAMAGISLGPFSALAEKFEFS